jgi:hypothetical protein
MSLIINIQPYVNSQYVKKTNYSDKKKYITLDDVENGYTIVRYDKSLIDMKKIENASTIGNMRSVIFSKSGELVCYSPPKSIQWEEFRYSEYYFAQQPLFEEYVEGTMINMFWDEYCQSWEFATKNTIGCKKAFQCIDFLQTQQNIQPPKTFEDMFLEAYYHNNLHYINFDKTKCYSFVLQHPENRIVYYISEPRVYLISSYKIENNCVMLDDMSNIKQQVNDLVNVRRFPSVLRFPIKYEDTTDVEDFRNHPDYNIMGIVIKNPKNGYYAKIRNTTYMNVKEMVGNSPSLLSRFVSLYKSMRLDEYVSLFPEHHNYFYYYQCLLINYIALLETSYHYIYILKNDINHYFTRENKQHVNMVYHLKQLHIKYRAEKAIYGASYRNVNVVEYVNEMDHANLFYALKQYYNVVITTFS